MIRRHKRTKAPASSSAPIVKAKRVPDLLDDADVDDDRIAVAKRLSADEIQVVDKIAISAIQSTLASNAKHFSTAQNDLHAIHHRVKKRLHGEVDGKRVDLTNLNEHIAELERTAAACMPTLVALQEQRELALAALTAHQDALANVRAEREALDQFQTNLHPLLKVSAHRDARDAFVPRSSSSAAAVKIPGVDIDEYTVDLEMSIAQLNSIDEFRSASTRVTSSLASPVSTAAAQADNERLGRIATAITQFQ